LRSSDPENNRTADRDGMRKLIEQLAEVIASYAAIDTELMWIAEACMQA